MSLFKHLPLYANLFRLASFSPAARDYPIISSSVFLVF
jgi:hypothetical protein